MVIKKILLKYLRGEDISKNIIDRDFQELFPEIACLKNVIQNNIYHPEGDVLTHILMMLNILPSQERNENIFWSILYHDVGKGRTQPTFKNHEKESVKIFEKNSYKLKLPRKEIDKIKKLILNHEEILRMLLNSEITDENVRKLSKKVEITDLLKLYTCDVLGRGYKNNDEELKAIEKVRQLYNLQTKTYEL